MKTKPYKVKGVAFVPAEFEITVHAKCAKSAIEQAQKKFLSSKNQMIISNSEDVSSAFDWQPEATEQST